MGDNAGKNEEIDLLTILNAIKGWIVALWNSFINTIRIIQKRWLLFLLFAFLGIGIGIGLYSYFRPVYVSSLAVSSKILSNDYCADMVGNLSAIVREGSPELLAEKLNIDVSAAIKVKKIEFSNYNEKLSKMYEGKDTIVLGIPFKIFVYAYNNTVFDTLEPALVKYLENNKYASKRKEIKRGNLEALRKKLSDEMVQLDTLKKNISENVLPRGTATGFVFGQPIDPINVYKASIDMFRNDLNLREELQLIDAIQVVDSFSPRNKPDSPKLWKMLVAGLCLMQFIALLIAFRLERKKA